MTGPPRRSTTRPPGERSPGRTNAKVCVCLQPLQREWTYALEYASSMARRASLAHWVRHDNERCTHGVVGNRRFVQRVWEVTGLDS